MNTRGTIRSNDIGACTSSNSNPSYTASKRKSSDSLSSRKKQKIQDSQNQELNSTQRNLEYEYTHEEPSLMLTTKMSDSIIPSRSFNSQGHQNFTFSNLTDISSLIQQVQQNQTKNVLYHKVVLEIKLLKVDIK